MNLSTTQNNRGQSILRRKTNQDCETRPSDCDGRVEPFQTGSRILFQFSHEEFVKIQSMKTLWNIQCEINPISLQCIFPLIDLAIGGGQNNIEIVHQHTKVTPMISYFHLYVFPSPH